MTKPTRPRSSPPRPSRSGPPPRPVFDRTVGFALVATIVVETAGAMHWAGRLSHRVEQLEFKARLTHPIDLRLARLEEQMLAAQGSLLRIEADLDAMEAAGD